jgi:hypothetical protein
MELVVIYFPQSPLSVSFLVTNVLLSTLITNAVTETQVSHSYKTAGIIWYNVISEIYRSCNHCTEIGIHVGNSSLLRIGEGWGILRSYV